MKYLIVAGMTVTVLGAVLCALMGNYIAMFWALTALCFEIANASERSI